MCSIPTATCVAQFNTPCAIEKVHQIVYDLAESFNATVTLDDFDALVAAVNAKAYNQPTLFWPTVLNSTGHILATGTEAGATYSGPPYVGGFFQDVLEAEGRHGGTLGGVFQSHVWQDVQDAADGDGYFFTNGKDEYHENHGLLLKTVSRVNYVLRVSTVAGEVYVSSAYSDMPVSDYYATTNCTASKDAMCSITNVRAVLGNVVTDMLKARDEGVANESDKRVRVLGSSALGLHRADGTSDISETPTQS